MDLLEFPLGTIIATRRTRAGDVLIFRRDCPPFADRPYATILRMPWGACVCGHYDMTLAEAHADAARRA